LLARDLARRADVEMRATTAVACSHDHVEAACVHGPATTTTVHCVDVAPDDAAAYVLVPDSGGDRLARIDLSGANGDAAGGADLTRAVCSIHAGARPKEIAAQRPLTGDDVVAWQALGLALTSADLVGTMRGALDVTVTYAAERQQFGVPVGSFQAVQHLLADAHCLVEGAHSVALHASWAVDALSPADALSAGRVAKAYCARAARTVCETAIQVHGGIGNTWECIVHVYLRRALLSSQWFGDDREQLRRLEEQRLGVTDGLS
jgi:hypothetical protein